MHAVLQLQHVVPYRYRWYDTGNRVATVQRVVGGWHVSWHRLETLSVFFSRSTPQRLILHPAEGNVSALTHRKWNSNGMCHLMSESGTEQAKWRLSKNNVGRGHALLPFWKEAVGIKWVTTFLCVVCSPPFPSFSPFFCLLFSIAHFIPSLHICAWIWPSIVNRHWNIYLVGLSVSLDHYPLHCLSFDLFSFMNGLTLPLSASDLPCFC